MIQSYMLQVTHSRDLMPERHRQAQKEGPGEPHEVQQIQVHGLAPGSRQPPLPIQDGELKD